MTILEAEGTTAAIRRIARRHGVVTLEVFGSQATGKARQASDLDLLVELEPERDLLDLVALKQELEALLGCQVDVVTRAALSPHLRDAILREARPLESGGRLPHAQPRCSPAHRGLHPNGPTGLPRERHGAGRRRPQPRGHRRGREELRLQIELLLSRTAPDGDASDS